MRAWWKARSKPGTLPEGGVYATAGTSSWPPQGLFDEPLAPPEPPREALPPPPVGASWARPVLTVEPPALPLPPPPAEVPGPPPTDTPAETRAETPAQTRIEMPSEFLRLLEVVTSMCDHVIEYIEADRVERRLMVETLTQLGHVITEGAATASFEARERVIGGSMPAGPERVLDLREAEREAEREPWNPGASAMEIAVEVRGRFGDRWVDGFEICEVMTTPDGPRYRLRRNRDGVVLPELFDATSIRHVETFDQLKGDHLDRGQLDDARVDGDQLNGSAGYWSRS
jgi:hypothetical protein